MAMSVAEVTTPLPFMVDVLLLVVFLIVGAIAIILLKAVIFFLPATILALVVWWFTHTLAFAGLAFAVVSIFCIFKKK
jgi:hypothetical protein